jgi:GNAT superfamily N-acetyltransferase
MIARTVEQRFIYKLHTVSMYTITTDKSRFDIDRIHRFLSSESYWAQDIPREVVELSIQHSLCFGAFADRDFAGFARVVTDYATFAYIADVFVLPEHRGKGAAREIMKSIREHAALQVIRRWHLVTRDAHALYAAFGFRPLAKPERHMEVARENPYGTP